MSDPLVSVLIPTFNRRDFVVKAIASALAQTYPNIEVVVHDDNSSDGTKKSLKKINDKRFRYVFTPKNHGMVGGWNFIHNLAKGEYIKYLADDDLLEPTCVAKLVKAATKHPNSSIVTCKRKFVDKEGNVINTAQFSNKQTVTDGRKHAHWVLTTIRENKIGEPSAVLYRKVDGEKAGLFDPQFSQFADFEFWIRLLEFGDIVYVDEPLCSFRTHADSNTSASHKDGRFITEIFRLIEKYYNNPHYQTVFKLDGSDRKNVVKIKTLDTLKNIKDLFISGKFLQARMYFSRLNKEVKIDEITKATISHLIG